MGINGKKILIVGANGFVGSRVCERLYLEYDAKIIGLVRNMGRASRIGRMKINIVRGNILDKNLVEKLVKDVDIVINLVAGDKKTIISGTKILSSCARKYKVDRFIHMSSAAVYGIKPNENCIKEDAPLRKTGNPYGDAKLVAEKIVNIESRKGLRSVMLRPRIIWGPYSPWVMSFYNQIINNTFCLVDNGEGACNTIFIDNLIDAIILSIKNDKAIGETFFVTDDEKITYKIFYNTWAKFLCKDINFISINSSDYNGFQEKSNLVREIKTFALSSNMKNLLLEAPLINKITKPVFTGLSQLPEYKKIWIKDFLGCNRAEKNIKSRNGNGCFVNISRIKRESGKGFTNIDKIKNTLGYKPNVNFKTGSKITKEWLEFADLLND